MRDNLAEEISKLIEKNVLLQFYVSVFKTIISTYVRNNDGCGKKY